MNEIRFPVELDSRDAIKELNKLERDIDKLKKSMADTKSSKSGIEEKLNAANDAAEKAKNKIKELKSELSSLESKTGIIDPAKFKRSRKKLLSDLQKTDDKRSGINEQLEQAANEADITREKIKKLKDELAQSRERTSETSDPIRFRQFEEEKARQAEIKTELAEQEKLFNSQVKTADRLAAKLQTLDSQYDQILQKLSGQAGTVPDVERQAEIKTELSEQEKILQSQETQAGKLQEKYDKINKTLNEQSSELSDMEDKAGELTQKIADAAQSADVRAAIASAQESIKGGIKNLLKYGIGIRSLFVLFRQLKQYTIEAVKAYAENDPETKKSINELKASLQGLKGSWGAAFAPVVNAVIPILKTLIDWLTSASNAVAMFLAIIAGKSTFKKAIANTGKLSENLSSGAGAAKELKKQLMGIDTLTIAQDSSGGGGGGGSGGAYDWVEEPINTDSLTGRLALAFKDVFVDWSDLTGEQIAEKIIAGLAGLAGGAVGFMIGGVPGAIIGTLAGLTIGLIADSIIFDHDGKLSTNEILNSLSLLLGAIGGGIIGFSVGNVPGAAIGAAVGIGLSLLIRDVGIETAGNWSNSTLLEKFAVVLGGLAGGLIGFSIGNIPGAALGVVFGILLTMNINNLDLDEKWIPKVKEWLWDDGILQIIESVKLLTVDPINDLINGITGDFEGLRTDLSGIVEKIKNLFNFQFQLPQLKLPHINVRYQAAGALGQFFGINQIPYLTVDWYAKGGIVDGATLIGAGEAGKEAIVPLERNTQWVTMVANELSDILFDRMTDKFAGLQFRMPAVAMGGVVPPNAFSSGYGYGISPELESKLDALIDRLTSGGSARIEPSDVYLDKRKVGEIMYTYTEERNRGRGK